VAHVRRALRACLPAFLLSLAAVPGAAADAGWFESGDVALRVDLQLLNDAGVLRVPTGHWPMPRATLAYALARAKPHFATNAAVATALARVQARMETHGALSLEGRASAGNEGLLRDFDALARDNGELGARAEYSVGRFALALDASGVADPADGRELRADGSHATVRLGNWLVSANTLERFWGPSHESSLILSNNARPMPTFMVERAEARPFEMPLLSWLGPWRFSFGISRMEDERADIDAPLFMAWRVTVMPFRKMEIGFTRTAQFCGRQLECNLDVFGNLLAGNDNVGIDASEENEPGNQMAGFDLRWTSPIGELPYAVYSQMIGEDESSYLPAKYLSQFGIEAWKPLTSGALVQAFAEYSSTTCSAHTDRGPYFDCAYNQGRFDVEGYRYHGRNVGHTTDADSETYSLGATYTAANGELWSATARMSELNRDDSPLAPNSLDTVATFRTKYTALELGWRGRLFGQRLAVDLGVQSLEPAGGDRDIEPYGFVSWRRHFDR
jgi:hypothetical protein